MRKLKIIEHISLDGVIQVSGEGGAKVPGGWRARERARPSPQEMSNHGFNVVLD
jgi:hypothetical protein